MICNVVSVLPIEYDCPIKVEESDECDKQEMAKHMLVYYYVMNNGCVEEQGVFFERPDEGIKSHLKPLFIREKFENTGINKVLIDRGASINMIPYFI